ncbi:MAG: hypothetical protein ACE37I_12190 [Rubinisphaera brasiliensis]|uniref:hypothetical protein n=1 Tax=Rubinisphaera brasiliensis TaxID=119 RepID=UPI000C3E5A74|nr:hypothetical protein [Planctomyces sp.]
MLGRMERTLPNRQFALRSAAFFAVVSLAMAAFGAWLTYRFTFGAGEADPLRFVGLTTGILTLLATLPLGWFSLCIFRRLDMFPREKTDH